MPFKTYRSKDMDGTTGVIYEPPPFRSTEDEIQADVRNFAIFLESLQAVYGKNGLWAPTHIEQEMTLSSRELPSTWGYYRPSQEGWERWKHSESLELVKLRIQAGQTPDSDGATDRMPEKLNPAGYTDLPQIAEAKFGTGSPEQFAAQVVDLAGRLDFAREHGFPYIAEAFAFQLGQLTLDRQIKMYAQKSWKVGEGARERGRKMAKEKNDTPEEQQQRDKAIAQAVMAEFNRGVPKMEIYEKVAKKRGVSVATVRRATKKLLSASG